MFIDFNQLARIGKIVALLGFFLPWVTVSCSDTEILRATGWQLMTGDPQPVGPMQNVPEQEQRDFDPAVPIIAAFAVILIGFGTSLMTRAQTAAISMLVCAVLGIGISYYGVQSLQGELQRELSNQSDALAPASNNPSQASQLSDLVASEFHVNEKEGYVVTHSGLALAAIFSLLTLFRRRQPGAEAPPASTG